MYLLDSNAFMEASRLYYSFRIAPGYWGWLTERLKERQLASVQAVYEEIAVGSGELMAWAKNPAHRDFWLADTPESLGVVAQLAAWAAEPQRGFKQSAVDEFMASADLRLVAQAKTLGAVVVSRETPDPNCRKRVKLPDAAMAVQVRCVQPFVVYEELGLTLS